MAAALWVLEGSASFASGGDCSVMGLIGVMDNAHLSKISCVLSTVLGASSASLILLLSRSHDNTASSAPSPGVGTYLQ